MKTRKFTTTSKQTQTFAAEFAGSLTGGEILLCIGQLGAGKTTFIQGALAHFGINCGVTSPTFVIKKSYPLPVNPKNIETIHHLDLYRIQNPNDLLTLDLEACFQPHDLTFIEWGEKIAPHLTGRTGLRLTFELLPDKRRSITIER